MTKLKKCPCGEVPSELIIVDAMKGGKWAYVYGSCCSLWMIEFNTLYYDVISDRCMDFAIKNWNATEREESFLANEVAELKHEIEWFKDRLSELGWVESTNKG